MSQSVPYSKFHASFRCPAHSAPNSDPIFGSDSHNFFPPPPLMPQSKNIMQLNLTKHTLQISVTASLCANI